MSKTLLNRRQRTSAEARHPSSVKKNTARTSVMPVYPLYTICSFNWRANNCVNSCSLIALLSSLIVVSSRREISLLKELQVTSYENWWDLGRGYNGKHRSTRRVTPWAKRLVPKAKCPLCRSQGLLLQTVRAELVHVNHTPRNSWTPGPYLLNEHPLKGAQAVCFRTVMRSKLNSTHFKSILLVHVNVLMYTEKMFFCSVPCIGQLGMQSAE